MNSIKVYVYFNLHKKTFSIKALEGERKGLVIAHRDTLTLRDVVFKVSEAGRQRVLRERKKNVHAGVVGYWRGCYEPSIAENTTAVTYNPYKYESFVTKADERPVYNAANAHLTNKQIFI